jgi:SAM-dependent methyltransferase
MRLPFRSGAFGAVVLHAILEHLADPRAALAETRRTLKRGGRAIVLVPNDFWMSVGRVLLGLWPPRHPDHRHWVSPGKLARWAEGFRTREAYGLPFSSLPFALNMYYFAVIERTE